MVSRNLRIEIEIEAFIRNARSVKNILSGESVLTLTSVTSVVTEENNMETKEKEEKEKLKEIMLNEFFQIMPRREIMKIFRAELRKEAHRIIKFYFEQIIPDQAKMDEIIRKTILGMIKK